MIMRYFNFINSHKLSNIMLCLFYSLEDYQLNYIIPLSLKCSYTFGCSLHKLILQF